MTRCQSTSANLNTTQQEEEIVFFDDFSTPSLDTTKWNKEITGVHVNNELQAYVDTAATISLVQGNDAEGAQNGALQIKPVFTPNFLTKDGQKFDFISGRINTKSKHEFTYGSFSARIKLPDGAGLWPAWWMLGNGNWPETGEIDIMEYIGEKDWASAAVHGKGYSGDAALVDRMYFPKNNDVTQWHIYTVEWKPDTLLFIYDEIPMLRITKPMTHFFGDWAFNNSKYLILNFAVGGVYPFKINGIAKPYYGLAETSLQSIKKGESKMLVDWVKVTKHK
ncbi:MAG: glycoside hydrolase family 16 protein [Sphingobacteriales bacterium]|nr:MAG: glycoside hydrolase family 16 protein [Sphingobacteriales bacterium]